MKKTAWLSGVLFILLSFAAGAVFAAEPGPGDRVGFLSLPRLLKETKAGQEASRQVEAVAKQKEDALKPMADALNRLKKELEESTGLSMDARRAKSDDYARAKKDYDRALQDARDEVQAKSQALTSEVYKKADGVVRAVAQRRNYSIILTNPTVMGYLDPRVDITDDVVTEMNK